MRANMLMLCILNAAFRILYECIFIDMDEYANCINNDEYTSRSFPPGFFCRAGAWFRGLSPPSYGDDFPGANI